MAARRQSGAAAGEADEGAAAQRWARLAGFLLLWLILTGLGGSLLVSWVAGAGPLPEVAARIAGGELLYRLGLLAELVETLSALLLGFALYRLLRAVDPALALLAFFWRAAEAILGCVGMILGFARLRVYLAAAGGAGGQAGAQQLVDLTRYAGSAAYAIGATCFAIGSGIFFWLFRRTAILPRWLSAIGIAASFLVAFACLAGLVVPEQAGLLQYGWAPMLVAELGAGLWLLAYGARGRGSRASG